MKTDSGDSSRPPFTGEPMTHLLHEPGVQADDLCLPGPETPRLRPWPVTALGLLLLLQAAGLFGFGIFHFMKVNLLAQPGQPLPLTAAELLSEITYSSLISLVFIPLSLLALITGIGFLRLWRIAWLNAMLVQGLSLLIAIIFYLRQKPSYVYIIMLYCIFMVIYLHHSDVQTTFRTTQGSEEPGERQ